MDYSLLVKNGRVVTEQGVIDTDIWIRRGKIVRVGKGSEEDQAENMIDAGACAFKTFLTDSPEIPKLR